MTRITLGGVPEYFNLPIHLALEENAFVKEGIELIWTNVPEGTGAMSGYLSDGTLDMAVILTEGIIKSIIEGNPSVVLSTYVESPLIWGVHTFHDGGENNIESLEDKPFAISRYGSGSHLMGVLMAESLGWDTKKLSFQVVHNLNGAIDALTNKTASIFLWEKYTTQPIVDEKIFKRIYEYPTPWPCFVIAANRESYYSDYLAFDKAIDIIFKYAHRLKQSADAVPQIVRRYGLNEQQVTESFSNLEYGKNEPLSTDIVKRIFNALDGVNAIKHFSTSIEEVVVKR